MADRTWRRRRGYVSVAAIIFVLGLTAPAAVAHVTGGNRDNWNESWNFTGWNLIESANYTASSSGTHNVWGHANSQCPGPGNQYQLRPVHEHTFIPDHAQGAGTYTCGVASNLFWDLSGHESGDFHLDVQKVNGAGDGWFVEGHTHFP